MLHGLQCVELQTEEGQQSICAGMMRFITAAAPTRRILAELLQVSKYESCSYLAVSYHSPGRLQPVGVLTSAHPRASQMTRQSQKHLKVPVPQRAFKE